MSNTKPRKLKIVRPSNPPLRLEEGEAIHVGVDVHKASYSVVLYSDGRGLITAWVQPARPEVLLGVAIAAGQKPTLWLPGWLMP